MADNEGFCLVYRMFLLSIFALFDVLEFFVLLALFCFFLNVFICVFDDGFFFLRVITQHVASIVLKHENVKKKKKKHFLEPKKRKKKNALNLLPPKKKKQNKQIKNRKQKQSEKKRNAHLFHLLRSPHLRPPSYLLFVHLWPFVFSLCCMLVFVIFLVFVFTCFAYPSFYVCVSFPSSSFVFLLVCFSFYFFDAFYLLQNVVSAIKERSSHPVKGFKRCTIFMSLSVSGWRQCWSLLSM